MVHIMPHWNVDVYDDEPVPVVLYTNCEEVELILNGKSLGRRPAEPNTALRWSVPYEPGRLEAIGYRKGSPCASDVTETADQPKKLILRLENRFEKPGDVALVACYAVDAQGRYVPNACPEVTFCADGDGTVISTGSDVSDHRPLNVPIRKMRAGLISVAVGVKQVQGRYAAEQGVIRLYAQAPGMESARLVLSFGEE